LATSTSFFWSVPAKYWPTSSHPAPCRWCASPKYSVRPRKATSITSAHRINQGSIPDLSPPGTESDFYFVQADDPDTTVARIIELVKTRIPKRFGLDPIRDIQLLCPMSRGGVGARSLNIALQAALNPAPYTYLLVSRPGGQALINRSGPGESRKLYPTRHLDRMRRRQPDF
jgi:hypothetical protein